MKLFLFVDDICSTKKMPSNSHAQKTLLELEIVFGKVTGYKIDI